MALVGLGFYLLVFSRIGDSVLSPWQTIDPRYIYVFFAATLTLGWLIVFSKLKPFFLLVFLIFYSLLLHSYLPLTHELFYGADGWRHIANEGQILQGHWPAHPVLEDGTQAGFGVGDLSYGLFWLVSAGLSKLLGVSLIAIIKWLQPILFSIAFPLLLWKLTEYLGLAKRERLLTIWFANFPFALQAAGAFSLPVNLGFLFFLGGLVILAARANGWASRKVLLAYAALLAVNYLLFLVLYLMGWGVLEFVSLRGVRNERRSNPLDSKPSSKNQGIATSSYRLESVLLLAMTMLAALVIPIIELLAGYSHFASVSVFSALKQFVGNFIGYYLASGPRTHIIAIGNIFFNQNPSYAFVSNLFTTWRWWIPIFMIMFLGVAGYGSYLLRKSEQTSRRLFGIFSISLFISYIIGRYFLVGEQIISRRLDVVVALLGVIGFMAAKERMLAWTAARGKSALPNLISFILLGSVAIAASYSLGPNSQTASTDEYHAMQYVWNQEKNNINHCVIADTYPLLALEAISGGKIVGGGFPIDKNFGQNELSPVFSEHSLERGLGWPKAVQLTYKNKACWFVRD